MNGFIAFWATVCVASIALLAYAIGYSEGKDAGGRECLIRNDMGHYEFDQTTGKAVFRRGPAK